MTDDWDHIDGEFKDIVFRTNSEPPWNEYIEDWYQHTSYIVADDENYNSGGEKIHNYDEVPTGSRNRWSFFKYYEDPPQMADCDGECAYNPAVRNVNFRVEVADGPNEQANLTVSNPYPADQTDKQSFGVSIGAGFGPISLGFSVSAFEIDRSKCSVDQIPYHYTEWDLDPSTCWGSYTCWSDWPDDQENAIGVHFDLDANSNVESRTIEAESAVEWEISRIGGRSGDRVYARTDSQDYHDIEVDIVEPNY